MRDSFDDLRAHQLAVMAGVEAAIKALLKRFEPAELEERMGKPGGFSNLFNGSQQAQNWQQFTELYARFPARPRRTFRTCSVANSAVPTKSTAHGYSRS